MALGRSFEGDLVRLYSSQRSQNSTFSSLCSDRRNALNAASPPATGESRAVTTLVTEPRRWREQGRFEPPHTPLLWGHLGPGNPNLSVSIGSQLHTLLQWVWERETEVDSARNLNIWSFPLPFPHGFCMNHHCR